jgi:hypothetical protein
MLQSEPGLQLITYLGNAIPLLPNGMASDLVLSRSEEWSEEWILVLEASISSEAKCKALILCVKANFKEMDNDFWIEMKVEVWRGGKLVMVSILSPMMHDIESSQVWLWTMRREHHAVQSLQYGDQICFLMRLEGDCTVVEGAICVVYNEDENLVWR